MKTLQPPMLCDVCHAPLPLFRTATHRVHLGACQRARNAKYKRAQVRARGDSVYAPATFGISGGNVTTYRMSGVTLVGGVPVLEDVRRDSLENIEEVER